jgi:hypothetical protein
MKSQFFPIVLLVIAFASFFTVQVVSVNAGADSKNIIYQATWQGDNISGELYVNGFVIEGFHGSQSFGTAPVNPLLIGNNKIWAKVRRADTSKPAYLNFGVSRLRQGDMSATNERGNLVSVELRDDYFKGTGTMTMGKQFASALDFSKTLSGAGNVSEKDAIEYAKKIYELFKAKDAAAIQKEFAVKINDYAQAYPGENVAAQFASYLKNDLLKGKLAQIDPQKLKAKRTGPNNKLWQVFEGDKELIRITSSDGSVNDLSIYIGMVDGKLHVVR